MKSDDRFERTFDRAMMVVFLLSLGALTVLLFASIYRAVSLL